MRASLHLLAVAALATACGRTDFFGDPVAPSAPPAQCGNGLLEAGEACEDGNLAENDGCRSDCTPAFCGDGVVFVSAELCDDGNTVSGDGCEPNCALPRCGDTIVQRPDESCDDGNLDETDACLNSCLLAFCGDGRVRRGDEECDDANGLNNDGCIACRVAFCGDGFVHAGVEECDDANGDDLDACTNSCRRPVCGDGIVSAGESCDLGPRNQDRGALTVIQGSARREVTPRVGRVDVVTFYDYRSASSHMGFEQSNEGRLILYLDGAGQLFLILNYGADQPGTQPESKVELFIEGVPASARTMVADDRLDEFDGGAGFFKGSFGFDQNTDGGAIGPLPYPGDWRISVTHQQLEGISSVVFLDGGTTRAPLDRNQTIFIESTTQPTACNTRCAAPACGDGHLDPGERCDSADPLCGPSCGF